MHSTEFGSECQSNILQGKSLNPDNYFYTNNNGNFIWCLCTLFLSQNFLLFTIKYELHGMINLF